MHPRKTSYVIKMCVPVPDGVHNEAVGWRSSAPGLLQLDLQRPPSHPDAMQALNGAGSSTRLHVIYKADPTALARALVMQHLHA